MQRLAMIALWAALIFFACGDDDEPTTPVTLGSCCASDGTCTLTPPTACGGSWTLGGVCTPNPCADPNGACCDAGGSCAISPQADCVGTWIADEVCTPNPCPASGACCMPDHTCTVTSEAGCSGVFIPEANCSPNPCNPPSGMRLIPSGTFTMGSPPTELGRWSTNEAPHQVTLTRAIYVGIHEVTQAEWEERMGWNDSRVAGPSRPVDTVTWYDAVSYCNQRSAAEGLTAVYTITEEETEGYHLVSATVVWNPAANGYRLPTEAEWEHACRASSTTAFSNGGITDTLCADPRLDQVGWYCGNAAGMTHDVGGKTVNGWGLADMHGNVWEWCWDYWEESYGGDATDPTGPAAGSDRVMRGGGWSTDARRCRSAHRAGVPPDDLYSGYGLRICRNRS